MSPVLLRDLGALRRQVASWKAAGESVGVVPTMGALHTGHLSLVEAAKATCTRVIATLFVNPRQFNNPEDLANYPRTEKDDAAKLAPFDIDVLYVPSAETMYPAGFATTVTVQGLTDVLCGAHRPGHFDGVATVVTKLLTQTAGDVAFFGEKDFQQLQIVRRLAADLDLAVEIRGCPTLRDADGLAMSSRNLRLSEAERRVAPRLYAGLLKIAAGLRAGGCLTELREEAARDLLSAGFAKVDYLDLRAEADLSELEAADRPARLFGAAQLGAVRLIDNIPVAAR